MNSEYFNSPLDGLRLFRRCWIPEKRPKAVVVYAHGMLEHSGRHADWAESFAKEHDIAVVAPDARGHGLSGGKRAWVGRFDDFLADYSESLRNAADAWPDIPLFAMGMSMGGAIATLTTIRKSDRIPPLSGLILVAPAIRFRGRMFPALHFAATLIDPFASKIQLIKPNFAILSRNPKLVEAFQRDPLVHQGKILLHLGTEMLRAMDRIQREGSRLTLPLLVLQGTADWVVTPSGARELVDAASSEDKTLKFYEGFYHALLHEPDRDMILADILDWCDTRALRPGRSSAH